MQDSDRALQPHRGVAREHNVNLFYLPIFHDLIRRLRLPTLIRPLQPPFPPSAPPSLPPSLYTMGTPCPSSSLSLAATASCVARHRS
jgi:hypothetical protein